LKIIAKEEAFMFTPELTEINLLNLTSPDLRGKFCGQDKAEGKAGFKIS